MINLDVVKESVPLGDNAICKCYQANCYLYIEKVLLDFLWHFKVSTMWISLKTLVLATFASVSASDNSRLLGLLYLTLMHVPMVNNIYIIPYMHPSCMTLSMYK